ncbi:MAG: NADH-quinone oxidoreductase subunit B [Flavobacteriales bacterium]|nr:NADH-quinone oxidoreductase subunit B [Flavobacteriales bacterium]MBP9159517.1 NADH-quinone oxidoreductase subunit B [Flavobacteriales bacterium]MCI1751673.1 NADH-quinone oxidoreductase subunit B [Flavobacteriales bacterium]
MSDKKEQIEKIPEREKPTFVDPPPGHTGAGFFATSMDQAIGLARKNSLWPLPFATSCCGIEFMSTMSSHYDLSRFGMERLSFSPRQSDLLMVMGTIAKKMAPVLREVYTQMAEPKWVLSMGACASSGGIFDSYSVLQGIDRVIPVDVYIPGCPPRPEQVIDGILKIQELAANESLRRRYSKEYEELLTKYKID